MYNNYPPPGAQYGRAPPSYGAFPGAPTGAPPDASGAPGMGPPPGVSPPPGVHQSQSPHGNRPSIPPNFQMPNINFNAPVIRLGTTGPKADTGDVRRGGMVEPQSSGGARRGLGSDMRGDQRGQGQDRMALLVPPTREEIARTIFVGNITDGAGGDEGLERIMRSAGGLRRWTRATDADGKPCKFGFAEFEDAESLETAAEIFKDVQVPIKRQAGVKKDDDVEVEMTNLLVVVDEASMKYAEEWKSRRDESEDAVQFRLDTARDALAGVLASLRNPSNANNFDQDGDATMADGDNKADGNAEVITIPLSIEDELSDIPAEMRETVASEIAAFRDRSNRRDMERLRREEELEAMERQRGPSGGRVNRLASPPTTAPSGPAGGANGIPLGPRDKSVAGAPSGPKGHQGLQIPKDYQNGVAFTSSREEDDSDASDEELERRRREKKEAEMEKMYLDQERRWLNRERSRTAAVEREKNRDHDEAASTTREREVMATRLKEWDDDAEAGRRVEEYYADRSLWGRNRATFRRQEADTDDRDRMAERREKARDAERQEQARGLADNFLDRQAEEMETKAQQFQQAPREPQRFKMSLGASVAQRAQAAAAARPKRTAAEVEGLLEDEEEANDSTKRTLRPIKFDAAAAASAGAADMTEEERAQAARQLAGEIPTDKEGLWGWEVKWEFVDDAVIKEQIKPFVEKKIVEYLGVQEQMLVDVVEEHVKKRGEPQELVGELEEALDEEAEALVKKLWRMLIFFSESEKRGLSN